jgi:hypothetical protein
MASKSCQLHIVNNNIWKHICLVWCKTYYLKCAAFTEYYHSITYNIYVES